MLENDISAWRCGIVLAAMIGVYLGMAIPELYDPKDWPDYDIYKMQVEQWKPELRFDYHVKLALGALGADHIGNVKIIPLAISAGFVVVTYLLAVQYSGKRYAALLAAGIVMASSVWRQFDTSAVHGYDWAFFFMLSMYFSKRKWYLNPVFFVLSIFCKSLAVLFLPVTLYMIYRSDMSLHRKLILGTVYGLLGIAFMLASTYVRDYAGIQFDAGGFIGGLGSWLFFFVVPDFWMAALMPLTMLMLLALWARGNHNSGTVLLAMLNLSLYGAFLQGFTDDIWNEPYRYAPLVAMFGVGVAVMVEGFRLRQKEKVKDLKSLPKME